ncbi:X-linked retinitis pigmentosa GTPase regulator-like [Pollicipes pollicipes]|uniref:X-linked retinitis pigmentosa GTPase regulator-like n=1 Tax=Pollicipes pollicipes TaxID=41117 RepID=UPI0018852D84|nr:X-linked retinitis pigmentosa GTPase regulator-like [Pollicipes pollicipes]
MAGEPEAELPETGAVLTFGRSRFAENQASRFWIKNDRVVACACGDEHTIVIAGDGKLFAFGLNQDGQLGLGHTESTLEEVTAWSGLPAQLGAGVAHTVALTVDGRLYTWGSNAEGQCGLGESPGAAVPTLVPSDDEIVNVSCGYRHTAFVTADGELFTFGENDDGQLGLGDRESRSRPTMVPDLQDVAQVACGGQHTIVLLESGEVFSLGVGNQGQLGLESGEVFSFGVGSQGQLGLGSRVLSAVSPQRLPLAELCVRQVAAGHCHSALVTDDGRLLTFGDSRHGKLCGSDEESNVFVPKLASEVGQLHVDKVVLGGCQSMVLVTQPTSPRMLSDLPPLTNGQHPVDGLHSAARQRRREREASSPPRGRSLPPLRGVPRLSPSNARREDEIRPDSGRTKPADACELQSVSSTRPQDADQPGP